MVRKGVAKGVGGMASKGGKGGFKKGEPRHISLQTNNF